MDNATIEYVGCTEGRGFSTTTQASTEAGGSFKAFVGVSVKAAYQRAQKEDTPVALQVVHDCLTLAQRTADSEADRSIATQYNHSVDNYLKSFQNQIIDETPHIRLSTSEAAVGETVVVIGSGFWANEVVDIELQAELLKQIQADHTGSFRTRITIPEDAPPASFHTTIVVSGESSAKSARAPFHTV